MAAKLEFAVRGHSLLAGLFLRARGQLREDGVMHTLVDPMHKYINLEGAERTGTPGMGAGEGYRSIDNIGEEDRQPVRSPARPCKPGIPNPQAIDQYWSGTC